jgi:two-component system, NarL family, sensor kinase
VVRHGPAKSFGVREPPSREPPSKVLAALLHDLNIGIANLSRSGKVLYCNPHFTEILGIPAHKEIIGTKLKLHLSPESWPAVEEELKQAALGAVEGKLRLECEGETRFVSLSLAPLRLGTITSIRAVAAEETELVEASKALDESQAKLQSLSAKILQLRDDERRVIARDLHDVTGQELAIVLMSLGAIGQQIGENGTARTRLKESVEILRKIENDIRTLSYVLHPPLLDESGLTAALRWYVEGLEKRTGLRVRCEVGQLPRLTQDRETALFRVVQESLTNVIRHAKATGAWIRSEMHANELEILVEDNGRGINPNQAALAEKGYSGGVGIAGMHQRLRQLGGQLHVSATGHGTVVSASAPVGVEVQVEEKPVEVSEETNATEVPAHSNHVKRILIADDHEVTRRGIRALLVEEKNFEICGEASNGSDAIAKILRLRPDLVILDLIMPQVGGLSVVTRLRQAGLCTKILVFTTHAFPGLEKTLQGAGCQGYVRKQVASQELLSAAKEVLGGGTYFPSEAN